MRVTAKLVGAFVLGMIVVTGLSIWLAIARETEEFHQLANDEALRQGAFLHDFVGAIWQSEGPEGVARFLASYEHSQDDLRISWQWDTNKIQNDPLATSNGIEPRYQLMTQRIGEKTPTANYVRHYWPVKLPASGDGGASVEGELEIAKPMTVLGNVKRDLIEQVLTWMGSSVLASGILMAYFGMRFVGRPLKEMAKQTREIAAGNLDVRVEVESNDELGELANSFNDMCGELKASRERAAAESEARLAVMEQLRHADRLKTVGRLAAGVAHELGTPLNVVAGRAELIASGKLQAEEIISSAETVKHEASRMTSIIRQLLDFARRRTPQRTWVDLSNVLDQTTTLLESLAKKNNTTIIGGTCGQTLPRRNRRRSDRASLDEPNLECDTSHARRRPSPHRSDPTSPDTAGSTGCAGGRLRLCGDPRRGRRNRRRKHTPFIRALFYHKIFR